MSRKKRQEFNPKRTTDGVQRPTSAYQRGMSWLNAAAAEGMKPSAVPTVSHQSRASIRHGKAQARDPNRFETTSLPSPARTGEAGIQMVARAVLASRVGLTSNVKLQEFLASDH